MRQIPSIASLATPPPLPSLQLPEEQSSHGRAPTASCDRGGGERRRGHYCAGQVGSERWQGEGHCGPAPRGREGERGETGGGYGRGGAWSRSGTYYVQWCLYAKFCTSPHLPLPSPKAPSSLKHPASPATATQKWKVVGRKASKQLKADSKGRWVVRMLPITSLVSRQLFLQLWSCFLPWLRTCCVGRPGYIAYIT